MVYYSLKNYWIISFIKKLSDMCVRREREIRSQDLYNIREKLMWSRILTRIILMDTEFVAASGWLVLVILYQGLTDNQRDVYAVVESQTGKKSADGEGPEGVRACGSDWCQKGNAVAQHQGGNPSLVIGDPSKQETADDGAAEEDRLCRRDEIFPVTYPI